MISLAAATMIQKMADSNTTMVLYKTYLYSIYHANHAKPRCFL